MPLLREILHIDLSSLHNNIAASQIMVIYFKIVYELVIRWRLRLVVSGIYTRQVLHMMLSTCVVFWPLFDRSDWSWRLNALVPAVFLARFFYKGAIIKDPEDLEVQTLSRSSSPSELVFGPLHFAAILVWLGLYRFMTEEAAILVAALGVGDGLAPLVGALYGRHFYQMPFAAQKTMEGSVVGVFVGTITACYCYLYLMGLPLLPLRLVLAYAGIAAIMEGTSLKGFDNLVVAGALHFSFDKVQEWLSL